MKILPILLKREFWEHRKTFFYLPLIILVLSVIFLIAAVFTLQIAGEGIIISGSIQINEGGPEQRTETNEYSNMPINALFGDQLTQFAALEPKQREAVLNTAYLLMATPLVSVLWVVVFMYFLTCLYDDRKDRSILFWKSMPVSDAMTVISKLLTGLLLVPGIYLVVMMILQLILLLTSLMAAVGSSIDIWATLIAPAQIVTRWIQMTAFFLFVAIWCLPIFAWVLFVSSWARSRDPNCSSKKPRSTRRSRTSSSGNPLGEINPGMRLRSRDFRSPPTSFTPPHERMYSPADCDIGF